MQTAHLPLPSLRSRRLEAVGTKKNKTGAREGDTRRVSPSRAPVLSFTHYFQAPATQANPSPKPTLTLTSHIGQNVGLGEG